MNKTIKVQQRLQKILMKNAIIAEIFMYDINEELSRCYEQAKFVREACCKDPAKGLNFVQPSYQGLTYVFLF